MRQARTRYLARWMARQCPPELPCWYWLRQRESWHLWRQDHSEPEWAPDWSYRWLDRAS